MNPKLTEDRPDDLVDRLNGIYPSAKGPYKASPLEKEAAREIVRLREYLNGVTISVDERGVLAVTIQDSEHRILEVLWER